MNRIIDYKCDFDNAAGIPEAVFNRLNLEFPEAYQQWGTMAQLALAIKEHEGNAFCELPFCHTLEGEALGGIINYGDQKAGPRAMTYTCTSLEDLLELPEIDFTSGRIAEVLRACTHLREQGEQVVLMISGPFTILNVLMDPRHVFKIMRKHPEGLKPFLDKIQNELIRFVEAAQETGIDMISYADSSGGVNILGPTVAEQVVHQFTHGFFKRLEKTLLPNTIVLTCPKTAYALTGTACAEWQEIPIDRGKTYAEGCIEVIGKTSFVGQTCLKNRTFQLENGIIKGLQIL